jgi:hypothetical protein
LQASTELHYLDLQTTKLQSLSLKFARSRRPYPSTGIVKARLLSLQHLSTVIDNSADDTTIARQLEGEVAICYTQFNTTTSICRGRACAKDESARPSRSKPSIPVQFEHITMYHLKEEAVASQTPVKSSEKAGEVGKAACQPGGMSGPINTQ